MTAAPSSPPSSVPDQPGTLRHETTADYLPEIFRQGARSSPLLAGLLQASDHLLLGFDQTLDGLPAYWDPWLTPASAPSANSSPGVSPSARRRIPISFLAWLASWLDFEKELHSSARFLRELGASEAQVQARRRLIVAEGAKLMRLRGTKQGLALALRLYFGIEVEIRERFWSERMLVGSQIGTQTRVLNDFQPARLVEVVWRVPSTPTPPMKQAVRWAIDREAPGHLEVLLSIVVTPESNAASGGTP